MSLQTILDIILILAAVWMIVIVRGLGGIIGRAMTFLTAGALVTGFAHGIATFKLINLESIGVDSGSTHRIIVLVGFLLLVIGFQQLKELKA